LLMPTNLNKSTDITGAANPWHSKWLSSLIITLVLESSPAKDRRSLCHATNKAG